MTHRPGVAGVNSSTKGPYSGKVGVEGCGIGTCPRGVGVRGSVGACPGGAGVDSSEGPCPGGAGISGGSVGAQPGDVGVHSCSMGHDRC